MPRDGTGVYTYPAGTPGTPDTTIESAKYNAYINDAQNDANLARPVIAGGTGASTAADARTNLGVLGTGGGSLTGNVTIEPTGGSAALTLRKSASGQTTDIWTYTAANARWLMRMGDEVAESGTNAGSNFTLSRYNDAGSTATQVLSINRASGALALTGAMSITGTLTTTGAINAGVSGDITGKDFYAIRGTNEGVIFLGSTGAHYLHWTGTTYSLPAGPLSVGGALTIAGFLTGVTTATFTGALSCGAITASGTLSCGAITSSGALALGTNGITCGGLTSTGVVNGAGHCTFGNATVNGGVLYMNSVNSHYIQSSGGVLNYNGQVILHGGNWSSYVTQPTVPLRDLRWVHAQTKNVAHFTTLAADAGGHCFMANYTWFNFDSTAQFRALQYLNSDSSAWVTVGAAS